MSLRIAFVGAGAINFGDPVEKVPWDHATRLERLSSKHALTIVGIADPAVERARAALETRLQQRGPAAALYKECRVFASTDEMLREVRPHAVWIGVPPFAHGSKHDGKDIELKVLEAGAAVFVEKPISCSPLLEVKEYTALVETTAMNRNLPVSVGYMFRYSKPVEFIRSLISTHAPGRVCAFNARYNAGYGSIPARFWWTKSRSGGPLVEQATHFIDIARHLCGEIEDTSISGLAISPSSSLGQLKAIPAAVDETTIPLEDRVERASVTTWRFKNGGIGTLNHALLLQGKKYENAITIWADGLSIEWTSPYSATTTVRYRVGDADDEIVQTFSGDDMYEAEDAAFLEALKLSRAPQGCSGFESGPGALPQPTDVASSMIRSTFADAYASYELSCRLRDALKFA